jgi:hypothetical protein
MNQWKGKTEPCAAPQWWRLWLLVIVFMFLEAFIICIVGPAMSIKEDSNFLKKNPDCCPTYKVWHEIWDE